MRRFFLISFIVLGLGLGLGRGVSLINHQPAVARQSAGCPAIPASPNYLVTGRETDAIAAINNARAQEGLHPLRLPPDFYHLDPVQQQFILVNLERTDRGLLPLKMDANLSQIAWGYSKQLFDLHFFSHTSPISGTFGERMDSNPAIAGHYNLAAENLAGNPVPGAGPLYEYMYNDAAELCGHRHNILDAQLTLIGISWIPGGEYGSVSAQEFLSSAPWNPYHGTPPSRITPTVSITTFASDREGHPLDTRSAQSTIPSRSITHHLVPNRFDIDIFRFTTYKVVLKQATGKVRVTWFLDHFGNQPHTGTSLTLDASKLTPGIHTLLAYVVDGEQNYGVAQYNVL